MHLRTSSRSNVFMRSKAPLQALGCLQRAWSMSYLGVSSLLAPFMLNPSLNKFDQSEKQPTHPKPT